MKKSSKRKQNRIRQRQRKWIKFSLGGGIVLLILGILGIVIWQVLQPEPVVGEAIPIPSNYVNHIDPSTPPGLYPSDPPAGGVHYATDLEAKFYEESDLASLAPYPEGSLVHNLEHGYVIFWYHCADLDQAGCDALKTNIRGVMSEFGGLKLIAFPWKSLDTPLAMTSWGRLLRLKMFDLAQARAFIRSNRNHAPEPNAP